MAKSTICNVPNARVPALKRAMERAGATLIEVVDNGNGTSNVTATYPQSEQHADLVLRAATS